MKGKRMALYCIDPQSEQKNAAGQSVWFTPFPFRSLARVDRVRCADGKDRTAWISGGADTFFSVPARVYVSGKTVTGFVWLRGEEWAFTPNAWRKNASLLPKWSDAS